MINLDDIESRITRGQYTEKDVQALLSEAQSVDAAALDRIGKGYRSFPDILALYSAVEQQYAKSYNRPTLAQRVAADKAASAAVQTAMAQAITQSSVNAQIADQQAQAVRSAVVQGVQQTQDSAAKAKIAVEQFSFNQSKTAELLKQKQNVQNSLVEQLGDAIPGSSSAQSS